MTKRRLEFTEGTSSKFWEIELVGTSVTVNFGVVGAAGQTKTKTFPSAEAAFLAMADAIEKRLEKGYEEVSPVKGSKSSASGNEPPPARRFTLVHASDPANTCELIHVGKRIVCDKVPQDLPSLAAAREHLQHVIDLRKKEGFRLSSAETLAPEEVRFFEGLTREAKRPPKLEVREAGDRFTVTFRSDVETADCTALLERLGAASPRFVQLICDPAIPSSHWEKAIKGQKLESVKVFVFDTPFQTQTRQDENTLGDLAVTLGAFPNLERVFATGGSTLKPLSHPALQVLHLLGNPLPDACLKGLAGSQLPVLERLFLSLAADAGPVSGAGAVAALIKMRAPNLRELHLDSLESVDDTLETLLKAGLPSSLKVLSLGGNLDEDDILEVLKDRAQTLGQLEVLALPLADEISVDGAEAVRQLLPNVRDQSELDVLGLPAEYDSW